MEPIKNQILNIDDFNIWDYQDIISYLVTNYKQFLLLFLVIIIIFIVDYINHYNNMLFGAVQIIPGTTNNSTNPSKKKSQRTKK